MHIARQIMALRVNEQCITTRYLALPVKASVNILRANAQGLIPGIDRKMVLSLPIPLPPRAEQKRIVAKVEELMALIDQAEAANVEINALATQLKSAILTKAIQGKLVPQRLADETVDIDVKDVVPKDEQPFAIPENWQWMQLKDIFDFVDYRGKTPKKTPTGVRLMTASNVRQGYIDHTRVEYISREEYQLRQSRGISKKGDILFTTEAPLGNAALADLDIFSAGQRVITLKSNKVEKALFVYFLISPYFQRALKDNATGTTAQGIKAAILKRLMLPVPPLAEQKRIVAKIEELFSIIDDIAS